jgi:hypothetical protein
VISIAKVLQQMPLPVKSDYNCQRLKSHGKIAKRDMTAIEMLERDVAREEKGKKSRAVGTVKARSKLQLKEADALGLAKDNRMEGEIPGAIGPDVKRAELADQLDGRQRRRAPTIDYKQFKVGRYRDARKTRERGNHEGKSGKRGDSEQGLGNQAGQTCSAEIHKGYSARFSEVLLEYLSLEENRNNSLLIL